MEHQVTRYFLEFVTSSRTPRTKMSLLGWTCLRPLDSGPSHVRNSKGKHSLPPPTDTLAGEIVPPLDQLATAGHGYAGSDGTKCITTRTEDRSNPIVYGLCPSNIKPVCKKRIGKTSIKRKCKFLIEFSNKR